MSRHYRHAARAHTSAAIHKIAAPSWCKRLGQNGETSKTV